MLAASVAARALAIGILTNTLLKLILAVVIGRASFRRATAAGLAVMATASAVALVFVVSGASRVSCDRALHRDPLASLGTTHRVALCAQGRRQGRLRRHFTVDQAHLLELGRRLPHLRRAISPTPFDRRARYTR